MMVRTIFSLLILAVLTAGGKDIVDNQAGLWFVDAVQSAAVESDKSSDPVNDDNDAKAILPQSQTALHNALLDDRCDEQLHSFLVLSFLPHIRAPPQVS